MARVAKNHARLMCGAAGAALLLLAGAGQAQAAEAKVEIAPQSLASALNEFGVQTGRQVIFTPSLTASKTTRGVNADGDIELALSQLLEGSGLTFRQDQDTFLITSAQAPQGGSAAGGGATVEALIVTAQKREEDIQDVPIAISAFTQKQLDAQKIEGGFDLLKAIPNVTFTKTNFTGYNFQIRGIGTQSISATSDPGVAVSFNYAPVIQNRLFEQEYLDMERVEVLRGPQGTLYGRNATAGVINVISAKPRLGEWTGDIKAEVGNYNTNRLRGMLNIPVGDTFAVRLAAAATLRDGYTYNSGTDQRIDGRELWTARLSLGWEPTPRLRINALWERFEEDDSRLRTGKQLCHRDDGPDTIGDTPVWVDNPNSSFNDDARVLRPTLFSGGCQPGSLFDDGAFDTPNGLAIPFIFGAAALGADSFFAIAQKPGTFIYTGVIGVIDPYGGKRQSRNLRQIESILDPRYRAEADLVQLSFDFELSDYLQVVSQTTYVNDETYSFQDFNRFNTVPVFTDTTAARPIDLNEFGGPWTDLIPDGEFCDPQLGCSKSIVGFDISQASAEQFNQEIRLQSSFDGNLNFSAGLNYTKFDVDVDYYVMFNILSALAYTRPFNFPIDGVVDPGICPTTDFYGIFFVGLTDPIPTNDPSSTCPYIDPNPIPVGRNFEGDGHNYFRSKNPYSLESWAGFGEIYWNVSDNVKVTAGLRYTEDKKDFTLVPTQVLLAPSVTLGGTVASGYPSSGSINQKWGEWTGRLGVDWKPDLNFTDETLLYAFYSRGYKGGGANPPKPGFADDQWYIDNVDQSILDEFEFVGINLPVLQLNSSGYNDTFEPEFVDAFELGAKNTLLDGAMTLNMTAFYYDYKDYQVSQIRDRTAVNENFDAEMWGLEFETLFAPTRNLQIIANLGYLNTRIADGERSIDIMNRTQGRPEYVLAKPWPQLPSNCVVPADVAEVWLQNNNYIQNYWGLCRGVGGAIGWLGDIFAPLIDPATSEIYSPLATDDNGDLIYPDINGGVGVFAELGGNELPNSPHWTTNIGAQYSFDLPQEWRLTIRGDAYWQSQSYHRVYNTEPYDKLHGWYNANLVIWAENEDLGLQIEGYVKNLIDNDPITGAFLNSDDTGLTTNVFMLDPRLYGISVRKSF